MITLEMLAPLGAIAAKFDFDAIFKKAGTLDGKKLVVKDTDEIAKLGSILLSELVNNIEAIAPEIIRFTAIYKGISREEAAKLDAIKTIKEIIAEEGILDFFKQRRG